MAGSEKSTRPTDLLYKNRKIIKWGKDVVAVDTNNDGTADSKKPRMKYVSWTERAVNTLGLGSKVTPARFKSGDKYVTVFAGDTIKCRVNLTKAGAARNGPKKSRSIIITVPSTADVGEIAEFLITNCEAKVNSFQPKARGRYYPLGWFKQAAS